MGNPQHGLALSDDAIQFFKWIDTSTQHPADMLDLQRAYTSPYYSLPVDIRGKPSITVHAIATTNTSSETNGNLTVEASLDGVNYFSVPNAAMIIMTDDGTITDILHITNTSPVTIMLYLRASFLRLVFNIVSAQWPYDWKLFATVVVGEV